MLLTDRTQHTRHRSARDRRRRCHGLALGAELVQQIARHGIHGHARAALVQHCVASAQLPAQDRAGRDGEGGAKHALNLGGGVEVACRLDIRALLLDKAALDLREQLQPAGRALGRTGGLGLARLLGARHLLVERGECLPECTAGPRSGHPAGQSSILCGPAGARTTRSLGWCLVAALHGCGMEAVPIIRAPPSIQPAGPQPISVLLVTAGSRGSELAFRFPPPGPVAALWGHEGASEPGDARLPGGYEAHERRPIDSLDDVAPDVLAQILAPKPALCDRTLDVALGPLRFVGYPARLRAPGAGAGGCGAELGGEDASGASSVSKHVQLCNVVFVLDARAARSDGGALRRACARAAASLSLAIAYEQEQDSLPDLRRPDVHAPAHGWGADGGGGEWWADAAAETDTDGLGGGGFGGGELCSGEDDGDEEGGRHAGGLRGAGAHHGGRDAGRLVCGYLESELRQIRRQVRQVEAKGAGAAADGAGRGPPACGAAHSFASGASPSAPSEDPSRRWYDLSVTSPFITVLAQPHPPPLLNDMATALAAATLPPAPLLRTPSAGVTFAAAQLATPPVAAASLGAAGDVGGSARAAMGAMAVTSLTEAQLGRADNRSLGWCLVAALRVLRGAEAARLHLNGRVALWVEPPEPTRPQLARGLGGGGGGGVTPPAAHGGGRGGAGAAVEVEATAAAMAALALLPAESRAAALAAAAAALTECGGLARLDGGGEGGAVRAAGGARGAEGLAISLAEGARGGGGGGRAASPPVGNGGDEGAREGDGDDGGGVGGGGARTPLGELRGGARALAAAAQAVAWLPLRPPPIDAASGRPLRARPYHALLLLCELPALLRVLPPDGSPAVRALAAACSPLRALAEVAELLALPLPEVFAAAGHLMRWGRARLISPITRETVLCLRAPAESAAAADGIPAAAVDGAFGLDAVLGVDVAATLGRSARPLGAHLDALPAGADRQARFVSRVLELVRLGLLLELAPFPLLVSAPPPPAPPPHGAGQGALTAAGAAAAAGSVEAVAAQQRRYAQLCRLAPLLDGTNRPSELLWRAPGIGRRELEAALAAHAQHVVVTVRPVPLDVLL
ncbi:hypothetical protein T492DRAFT_841701 [Pavlovales sp. CCMP2436]|nr:hypothetical protein T492DRAFT_841701 [Pavlovales sp. CCMP2436]